MDNMAEKYCFYLLMCWISFKGCAGAVTMPERVTFWVEDISAPLSCRVTENPSTVTWSIGTDPLTKWDIDGGVKLIKSDGKYGMTADGPDFVLIINNISVSDAHDYSCGALLGRQGRIQSNKTEVTVYGKSYPLRI
eukprot:XP_011660866.1 PREDICTED: uncharacterized protein LOC105436721 [Strongylocentrotus purpuratus]